MDEQPVGTNAQAPAVPAQPAPRSRMAAELEALLTRFRTDAGEIEARIALRVQERAVEQSRAMQATEHRIGALEESVATLASRMRAVQRVLDEIAAAQEEDRGRLEAGLGRVEAVQACARKIDAHAGDRFGARLEAMGVQVAHLADLAVRVGRAEDRAARAEQATAVQRTVVETMQFMTSRLAEQTEAMRAGLDELMNPADGGPSTKASEHPQKGRSRT